MFYTLDFAQKYDNYYLNGYQDETSSSQGHCGISGQRSGLTATFSQSTLQFLPYNQPVEIPFTVTEGRLCKAYKDISLIIIATCELPTSNSQIYQYGIVPGSYGAFGPTISYNASHILYAANSTASFSVAWQTKARRRQLHDLAEDGLAGEDNDRVELEDAMQQILKQQDDLLATVDLLRYLLSTGLFLGGIMMALILAGLVFACSVYNKRTVVARMDDDKYLPVCAKL